MRGGVDYALNRALAAWNNDKQASLAAAVSAPVNVHPAASPKPSVTFGAGFFLQRA